MTKISDLTAVTTAAGTDALPVVQSGDEDVITKKATIQDYIDDSVLESPTGAQAKADAAEAASDPTGSAAAAQAAAQAASVANLGDTMTGLLDFSGTGHAGINLNKLTSIQRDALAGAAGMIIWNTDDEKAQYYDGSWWKSAEGIKSPYYLLHDRFSSIDTAPITAPRTAEPGPETWSVTDSGNLFSVDDIGNLGIDRGGSRSDPLLTSGPFTAQDGLCFYCRWRQDEAGASATLGQFGFGDSDSGDPEANKFKINVANIQMADGTWFGGTYTTVFSGYVPLIDYEFAIILDGANANYYMRGGILGEWLLLGQLTQNAAGTLYASLGGYNRVTAFSRAAVIQLPTGWSIDDLDIIIDDSYTVPELESLFSSSDRYVEIERDSNDYIFKQRQKRGEVRWFFNEVTVIGDTINVLNDCEWWENGAKVTSLTTGGSTWEYATIKSGGGFMGNGHGDDNQTALAIFVDGVDHSSMTSGQSFGGLEIIVTRTSDLADGTNDATVTTTYTINHETGLTVSVSYSWSSGSNPNGWDQMLPHDVMFDTARQIGFKNYDMDVLSGVGATLDYSAAIIFERNGNYGMLFTTEDTRSGYLLQRALPDSNKLYSSIDDVDETSANYRVTRLSDAGILM